MNSQKNTAASATPVKAPRESLFGKDFTLVVLGQIISLFGNAILRFALPLYILDQSGSAALFGIVSASAFLPMVIMTPIGGIIADRVNKQRIMVVLDFFTAAIILGFILVNGLFSAAPLVVVMLMFLYAIQGAYTPAVQASLPVLAKGDNLVPANAAVNLVSSFSGLLGPVIGGMLYAKYGLAPIMAVSCGCFAFSAIMELFIRIPHTRRAHSGSVLSIVREDMGQSVRFILGEKPVLGKVIVLIFCFNLFMSCMLIIGTPVLITQTLGMDSNALGMAQAAQAAGGLIGGLLAGVLGKRLDIRRSYLLLACCGAGILPIGLVFLLGAPAGVCYLVISAMNLILMIFATLFSIQMLSFVQAQTPAHLVGKVLACLMGISTCAQPFGQALYGVLFENLASAPWIILFGSAIVSCLIAIYSKTAFHRLSQPQAAPQATEVSLRHPAPQGEIAS